MRGGGEKGERQRKDKGMGQGKGEAILGRKDGGSGLHLA